MLLGVDNPLLDNPAKCEESFKTKYGLKPENTSLVQKDRLSLYNDTIYKYEVEYNTGVATLNSARVGKRIPHSSQVSSYCRSISDNNMQRDYWRKIKMQVSA